MTKPKCKCVIGCPKRKAGDCCTPKKFRTVFPEPDAIGQSEYRAIHDTIVDGAFDGKIPNVHDEMSADEVAAVLAMLDEFADWAKALKKKLA